MTEGKNRAKRLVTVLKTGQEGLCHSDRSSLALFQGVLHYCVKGFKSSLSLKQCYITMLEGKSTVSKIGQEGLCHCVGG